MINAEKYNMILYLVCEASLNQNIAFDSIQVEKKKNTKNQVHWIESSLSCSHKKRENGPYILRECRANLDECFALKVSSQFIITSFDNVEKINLMAI